MNRRERKHLATLDRRARHLDARIEALEPEGVKSLTYDRAEREAIRWATAYVRGHENLDAA